MADYALYRMRLRQENKLANLSSKIDKDRALAGYRQALQINNIDGVTYHPFYQCLTPLR